MTRFSKLGGAALCGAMLFALLPATSSEGGLFRRLGGGSHGGGSFGSHGGWRHNGCGSHGGYSNGGGSHGGYGNGNGSHGGYVSNGCGSHGGHSNGSKSHDAYSGEQGEQRVEYRGDYDKNRIDTGRAAPEAPNTFDNRSNNPQGQELNIEQRPQIEQPENQGDNNAAAPPSAPPTPPEANTTPEVDQAPPQ